MNGFDIAIVAVIVLSALFAFARGIVREMLALATWVLGFVLAIAYSGEFSALFSWVNIAPSRYRRAVESTTPGSSRFAIRSA